MALRDTMFIEQQELPFESPTSPEEEKKIHPYERGRAENIPPLFYLTGAAQKAPRFFSRG